MTKKRILVIDDEPGVTMLVKLNLDKLGRYEVRTENDPSRAIAVTQEFLPHLILLDVVMPGMDGGDLAALIRADPRFHDTPIVFLTAIVSHDEAGQAGVVRGGMHFLAKPVKLAELVGCLDHYLQD